MQYGELDRPKPRGKGKPDPLRFLLIELIDHDGNMSMPELADALADALADVSCARPSSAILAHRPRTWITSPGAVSTKRSTIVLGPMADKVSLQQMLTGRWIKDKRNLMITGPCGVGKTWLACALAQSACRDGITVLYKRMPRLFDEVELAHGPSRQIALQSPAGQWTGGFLGCSKRYSAQP